MPRAARIVIDAGYYHVFTRGNDRRRLFCFKQDYLCLLEIVKKYLEKYEVGIVHYCLMPNHMHLLVNAKKAADLPKFMQGVLQVYAVYFRRKYNHVGFVFQNRYKSCYIPDDSYLLECARYIERNPLRAKIVDNLSQYSWSSFFFYTKGRKNDIITFHNPLYSGFGKTDLERREQYSKYVFQERPFEHIVDQAFKID